MIGGRLSHSKTWRHAFTLIELLVVVAVVGILAGLLLPALARSKACAQKARCASNVRQLALAAQMYWDDNEGGAFRYRGASTNGGDVYWFGWLERWSGGNEGQRRFDATQGALYPYLQGRGVETCPSLNAYLHRFKPKANEATYAYGVNFHLTAPLLLNVARVTQPSDLIVFADAAQVNTFQAPASPSHPLLEEFYYVNAGEATAHFRHGGRLNAAFCDGHVASELPVEGSLDPRLPNARVGRLPAAALKIP
jgi:prepilin-type N-terminal cleavage/methylation domain-containing protein/prepilin-type processing-associated H-X9-DG protein